MVIKAKLKKKKKKNQKTKRIQLRTGGSALGGRFSKWVFAFGGESGSFAERECVVPHWFSSCVRFPSPGRRERERERGVQCGGGGGCKNKQQHWREAKPRKSWRSQVSSWLVGVCHTSHTQAGYTRFHIDTGGEHTHACMHACHRKLASS